MHKLNCIYLVNDRKTFNSFHSYITANQVSKYTAKLLSGSDRKHLKNPNALKVLKERINHSSR